MTKAPAMGPNTVPMPPTKRHEHHLARHRPMHVRQRGQLEDQRLGRAGDAGQRRRQHEDGELVLVDAVAERHRAGLVVADRLQHLPERRVDDPVDQQQPGHENDRHQRVERTVAR